MGGGGKGQRAGGGSQGKREGGRERQRGKRIDTPTAQQQESGMHTFHKHL